MSSADNHKLTARIKAHGCAAKLSSLELAQIVKSLQQFSSKNLLCGTENFEDAAVYKLSEEMALVATIDFFPPLLDDPFLYGRIAAVNALSDVYAMGAKPLLALNVLCFPTCDFPLSVAEKVVAGGASAVREADCLLVGGHSIQSTDPIYGLAVIGIVDPKKILKNSGAKAADALLLCKALGTGIGLLAHKGGLLSNEAYETMLASICRLNANSLKAAMNYDIHAATDITGFGFIGHIHEMAKGSGLKAVIDSTRLPLLPEVKTLAEQGIVPAAAYANRNVYQNVCRFGSDLDLAISDILYDPQTSGGLLFALPEEMALELCSKLTDSGVDAAIVGSMQEVASESEIGIVEVI